MHTLIDCCYDSQVSLSRVLSMDISVPENVNKPKADNIKKQFVPNANFKDEMYSSGSPNNSISQKLSKNNTSPCLSDVKLDSFKKCAKGRNASVDQKRMHGVVDNCFDSQEISPTVLQQNRLSKEKKVPEADKGRSYGLPNDKFKDQMFSSGSSCDSV